MKTGTLRQRLAPSTQLVNHVEIALMFGSLITEAPDRPSVSNTVAKEVGCLNGRCPFNDSCDRSSCHIFESISTQ